MVVRWLLVVSAQQPCIMIIEANLWKSRLVQQIILLPVKFKTVVWCLVTLSTVDLRRAYLAT